MILPLAEGGFTMAKMRYVEYNLEKYFDQNGAEMVEYAIVLACIAAVGVYFYSNVAPEGTSSYKLSVVLGNLWSKIFFSVKSGF